MRNKTVRQSINGNSYIVKTRDWFWGKSVKVSDTGDSWAENKTRYATTRDWFHMSGKSIETLIQETLNEAVCRREEKMQKKKEYNQRITEAVSRVGEAHDE